MIATLEAEAEEDASQKAYCDKELSETNAKKDDLATLQNELAGMAQAKAEADKLREEENAAYQKNSAEMELGIEGVKKALKVLRDYYAQDASHGAAEGAGSSIIGLLEVCESDFTKGLTEMTAEEQTAAADYKS